MSKFLLNLLVQIFKVCQKSEIRIKFKKVLLLELGPAPVFGPAAAHCIFSFPNRPLSLSPLGLGRSAGPAHPLGPADRASVVPCQIDASLTGKRLTSRRHRPLCARLTGGPHLSSPSSGSTKLGRAATASRHLRPPLSTSRYHPRAVTPPPSIPPHTPIKPPHLQWH
jgi:hypothetical protein